LRLALDHLRELTGLPEHAPIVELPERESSFVGRLLGIEGLRQAQLQQFSELVDQMARTLGPLTIHAGDEPLMRLEVVPVGE
jgi:hypothetical protein